MSKMKRYAVSTPEELRSLAPLVTSGSIEAVAAVWSASARRGGGESPWNGKVFITFNARKAVIQRVNGGGELIDIARAKYNAALAWSADNLARSDDDRRA